MIKVPDQEAVLKLTKITQDEITQTKVCKEKTLDSRPLFVYAVSGDWKWRKSSGRHCYMISTANC
jgi:hypothetical protein